MVQLSDFFFHLLVPKHIMRHLVIVENNVEYQYYDRSTNLLFSLMFY